MADMTNFYEDLDLKYPEIAIAMQDIDKVNPGKVLFSIPILTPGSDTNKITEEKIRQDSRQLANKDMRPVDIQTITKTNYIEIEVPSELCCTFNDEFKILHNNSNANVQIIPINRYIPKGSKWIVVFLGGDVTNPRIIARCPE